MSPIVVTEIEAVDSWCLTTPVSGFSIKCQWELWNGDWWDLKAPVGSCVSAESGENQIVLTGCSCDWQSVEATRSVGRTRSAGGGITGNKTVTCPTKRWSRCVGVPPRSKCIPATASHSSRLDLMRKGLIKLWLQQCLPVNELSLLEMKTRCGVIWGRWRIELLR